MSGEKHKMEKALLFISAINKYAPKVKGEKTTCRCPFCIGTVTIYRDKYNGHIWARCSNCKANVMQ